jgi:hypothetical protein
MAVKKVKKEKVKTRTDEIIEILSALINAPVEVTFGKHRLTIHVRDVINAKKGTLRNPPDKIAGEDGREYTPDVVQLLCDEGLFTFHTNKIVSGPTIGVDTLVLVMEAAEPLTVQFNFIEDTHVSERHTQ